MKFIQRLQVWDLKRERKMYEGKIKLIDAVIKELNKEEKHGI